MRPTILIIDDEPDFHENIRFSLTAFNFESAYTIQEGRKKIEKNSYELILLDLNFDSGNSKNLEGINFISEIKQHGNTPVVIVSSAPIPKEMAQQLFKDRVEGYLAKDEISLNLKEKLADTFEKTIKKSTEEKTIDLNLITTLEQINEKRKELLLLENRGSISDANEIRSILNNKEKEILFNQNSNHYNQLRTVFCKHINSLSSVEWKLQPQINVLLGKNGYGKSYLLKIMVALLQNDREQLTELFGHSSNKDGSFAKVLIRQRNPDTLSQVDKKIKFTLRRFDNKIIGKIPILAIADNRCINRSAGISIDSNVPTLQLLEQGGRTFYEEHLEDVRIRAFLSRMARYYERGEEKELFELIEQVMENLFEHDNFKINSIDTKGSLYIIRLDTQHSPEHPVEIQHISRGILSVLGVFGLIYEYLKQLKEKRNSTLPKICDESGIVIIDEVEAHLHPDWQEKIISIFRTTFPHVQFILSSHSPLVVRGCLPYEVSVMESDHNKRVAFTQLTESFVGDSTSRILQEHFEVENKDETYLNYKDRINDIKYLEQEIQKIQNLKEISLEYSQKIKELKREIKLIEEADIAQEEESHLDNLHRKDIWELIEIIETYKEKFGPIKQT